MKHVISIYLLYSFAHKNRGQADNFICKNKYKKHYIFSHRFGECGRSWWLQEIAMKAGWLHDTVMGVCDFRKLR
jgi:hypothetical protein